ncbi:GNAT family N-acetyltransferase [soil metagenome]
MYLTEQDFAKRISSYLITWPWLVLEDKGIIAGYAYAGRHRERLAYQWSVESSVYTHPHFRRKGIASALYQSLFRILTFQGFRNVYAGITLPNENSIALHEKFGFKWFADYENTGFKRDKWNTVGWWRKTLNDFENAPASPIKFSEIDRKNLRELLMAAGGDTF